ncbi:MAG: hypothetical protein DRO11_03020 [Methanobacteriota archaeon]|nr:MAG: hypothetical protein DRO11_03020 [Euryarchaeota archaeon]
MNPFWVYISVISAYLAILILIGVITSKKLGDIEDFYLAGRRVGPWVTAFSFVAAYFSSVLIIGGGGFGYKYGMATLWIGAINVLLGCTLAWIILGPRLRELTKKLNAITVPSFFSNRYLAPETRIYSATIISIFLVVYCVSILKGMGNILEVLMEIPYYQGVLISGLVIAVYVALGGYLAVLWTSFVQAWVMLFGVSLLTIAALQKVGGYTAANTKLAAINPELVTTPGVWGWAGLVSYCLILSFGVWGMPQLVIRFYSIKSKEVLRLGTVLASIGGAMALLPYLSGAVTRVLYPNLPSPDHAIPTLSKAVLPTWGSALFLAAVLAAGMSTFSSVLIIISSSLIKDLYQDWLRKGVETPEKRLIAYGRLSSLIVGGIALIVALKPPALILVLTAFSWAVIASACLWPTVLGVYWRGATRAGATASMVGGSITALIWLALRNPFGVHGFIPGILVGLILFILVSLSTKKLPEEHLEKLG